MNQRIHHTAFIWGHALFLLLIATYIIGCGGDQPAPPKRPSTATTSTKPKVVETSATGTASISGIINFSGTVPKLKTVDMGAVAECKEQHSSDVISEALVLGENNTVGNVVVKIKSGLPSNAKYDPPTAPVEMDQVGCIYTPHVLGVQAGQTVKFKNSDSVPHNVHTLSEKNKAFNKAVNKGGELEMAYDEEETFFVKCDIHPWMKSYVSVISHPFFHVTQKDGKYQIKDLPAGKYTVEIWHERLGEQTKEIEVADGQSVQLDFTLSKS